MRGIRRKGLQELDNDTNMGIHRAGGLFRFRILRLGFALSGATQMPPTFPSPGTETLSVSAKRMVRFGVFLALLDGEQGSNRFDDALIDGHRFDFLSCARNGGITPAQRFVLRHLKGDPGLAVQSVPPHG